MDDQVSPPGFEPWCSTLRGEQAWCLDVPRDDALATWQGLRDRHHRTGLWPLLLGSDRRVVDQLTWRLDLMARHRPGIPVDVPSPDELLVDWLGDVADDDFLADVPRHLDRLVNDADAIRTRLVERPDEDAVRALDGPVIHLALVPAAASWEVPAPGGSRA